MIGSMDFVPKLRISQLRWVGKALEDEYDRWEGLMGDTLIWEAETPFRTVYNIAYEHPHANEVDWNPVTGEGDVSPEQVAERSGIAPGEGDHYSVIHCSATDEGEPIAYGLSLEQAKVAAEVDFSLRLKDAALLRKRMLTAQEFELFCSDQMTYG